MSTLEITAFVQAFVAIVSFALGGVGMRIGRYTIGVLGFVLGVFFIRISVVTYGREHPGFDFIEWASSPAVLLLNYLLIGILLTGVVIELAIREWTDRDGTK